MRSLLRWILPWPLLAAALSGFTPVVTHGLLRESEILLPHRARIPAGRSHAVFACRGFEVRDGQTWAVGTLRILLLVGRRAGFERVEEVRAYRLPVTDVRITAYQPRAYPEPVPVTRLVLGGTSVNVRGVLVELPATDTVWFGNEAGQAGVRAALARGTKTFLVEALHGLDFGAAPGQVPEGVADGRLAAQVEPPPDSRVAR